MMRFIIVEDDPMVGKINAEYLHRSGDFEEAGIFSRGQQALEYLRNHPVDLAIVDIYMPGMNGIDFLRTLRSENINVSVIVITAAAEVNTIDEALNLGIVDYLIKPFSFQRFQRAVNKFISNKQLLCSNGTANQDTIDLLFHNDARDQFGYNRLAKGLNPKTMENIYNQLNQNRNEPQTCESLSVKVGLSKVTVRRYLNYLVDTGQAESRIDYGTGGRPGVTYRLKKETKDVQ
ncbi:MAG: response regulator [Clostridiales bacterium]|nr:response regulator [Clostridiales bacterium]